MEATRSPSAISDRDDGLDAPLVAWQSWTLSLMMFLALFARDGRFQMLTSAGSLALVAVLVTRWKTFERLSPGPLILFAGWAVASASWSAFFTDSIVQLINLAVWTALGLVLASVGSAHDICRIWARASYAALGIAVLESLSFAGGGAADGWFNSKNQLGFAAAASLIPLIALYWQRRRALVALAIGAAFLAGVLANTQTGVTLSISIPVLFIVARVLSKLRGSALTAAGLIAFAGLGIVGVVTLQMLIDWVTGSLGRDSKLSGRDQIWNAVQGAIEDRPVFGTGFGGVWKQPEKEPTLGILVRLPDYLRGPAGHAHNGFLDAGLQLGLVGLALLVLVIIVSLRRNVQYLTTSPNMAAAMPLVATLTYVIANTTETRLYNDQAWVILVAALAVPIGSRLLGVVEGSGERPDNPSAAAGLRQRIDQ